MKRNLAINGEQERGATIIEFAFVVAILLGLIGAIIDFGLHIHRFNLVTHIVKQSTRVASKYSVVVHDCNEIADKALQKANEFVGMQGVTFEPEINSGLKIRLTARRGIDCFFICSLLPESFELTTVSEVDLEMPCQLALAP